MKRIISILLALAVVALVAIPAVPVADAASPNMPAVSSPIQALTFHLSGTYSATKSNLVQVKLPYNVRVLYVTAVAQAKGGNHQSSRVACYGNALPFVDTIDLGTPAAATVVEGTILDSPPNVAKDTALACDLNLLGPGSPTLSDITLSVWVQRRN